MAEIFFKVGFPFFIFVEGLIANGGPKAYQVITLSVTILPMLVEIPNPLVHVFDMDVCSTVKPQLERIYVNLCGGGVRQER